MAWTECWTPEVIESNYAALGVIEHDDIVQLIEDAKLLAYLEKHLGRRDFNDMIAIAEEREDTDRDD